VTIQPQRPLLNPYKEFGEIRDSFSSLSSTTTIVNASPCDLSMTSEFSHNFASIAKSVRSLFKHPDCKNEPDVKLNDSEISRAVLALMSRRRFYCPSVEIVRVSHSVEDEALLRQIHSMSRNDDSSVDSAVGRVTAARRFLKMACVSSVFWNYLPKGE
jgi:hypothetical protein